MVTRHHVCGDGGAGAALRGRPADEGGCCGDVEWV